jgi:hypothetical protein
LLEADFPQEEVQLEAHHQEQQYPPLFPQMQLGAQWDLLLVSAEQCLAAECHHLQSDQELLLELQEL